VHIRRRFARVRPVCRREVVNGHDHGNAEVTQGCDVAREVWKALIKRTIALAAKALDTGNKDSDRGRNAGGAHDDVEVFFCAKFGSEAGFVHNVVGEAQSHSLREDGTGAMGDVGEGASVHKSGRTFGSLHQIRQDRVGEKSHHGAGCTDVGRGDWTTLARNADDDGVDAAAKIGAAGGEAENGHDLRSGGDDEAGFTIGAFAFGADCNHDTAQCAVIGIERAGPRDLRRIEIERVAVKEKGIDHGGEQVVRGGDGVKVAVKMEIDFLAGLDLRQTAARCAALESEDRPSDGSREVTMLLRPMRSRPWARPMETTVLPSPETVGVVAVTRMSLPRTGTRGC